MNNKSEKLYIEIFAYLESIINTKKRENITNITITIDFEIDELNAIKLDFPNKRLTGNDSILKKISKKCKTKRFK